MKRAKKLTAPKSQTPALKPNQKKPFIEHIYELRKRLFHIAFAAVIGGGIAYWQQEHLLSFLLHPAGSQQFIYTSPGGGFSFLFNLCLYAGIVFAIPVIVWQLLRYLQPLIQQDAMRFIWWGSFASGVLALLGIAFGYIYGLPAAMHFLLHQFSATDQIQALIAIQSYMSFVMLYLVGSALLFQVPLIMVLINRIKPLNTGGLMKFQRWFIVIAFILGAIINPSPNIQDQLMLSVPMILMYQLGIGIVWFANRNVRKARKVQALLQKDQEARSARLAKFHQAQDAWITAMHTATGTAAAPRKSQSRRTWQEAAQAPVRAATPPEPTHRAAAPVADIARRPYQTIRVSMGD